MNTVTQWPLLLEQFHWLRPWWLSALLPVVILLVMLWRQKRAARQWQALVAPDLLPFLLDGKSVRQSPWQIWLLAAAWVLAVLALAGPTWEKRSLPVHKNENALVIVLDLSPSMLSEDIKPSRLVRARLKIADILRERGDGLTALVVYSGAAHVVAPLTDDTATINNLLSALHPNIMPAPGSNTEAAIARALQLLRDAGATQGDLLLISDGVVSEARAAIKGQLRDGNYRLSVLGVGGETPAPIPGRDGSFVRDRNNNIVTTQLDSQVLRNLADDNNGRYSKLASDNRDIDWLLSQPSPLSADFQQLEREFDSWYDRGYWLVFLLLPIILYHFRRGALAMLLILPASFFSASDTHAFEWRDLWLTEDQQGQQALQQGDAQAAAETFEDPLWKGSALYRAEDYAAAAEYFAQDDSAQGHYNRGNALSKAGKLKEGLAAYDEALERQPDFPAAEANRELVQKLLEQQEKNNEQQQNNEQQNSEQQDGEQNQDQQNSDQQSGDNSDSGEGAEEKSGSESEQQDGNQNQSDNAQNGEQDSAQPSPDDQQAPGEQQDQQDGDPSADNEDQNEGQNEDDHESESESEAGAQPEGAEEGQSDEQHQALAEGTSELTDEQQRALEQWLRRVPDDPSGLLRNKFRYQHEQLRQQQFNRSWSTKDNNTQERW